MICINPDCERWTEGNTDYCASCNSARRRAERQASKPKKEYRIKKVSDKHAKRLTEYYKLAKEYKEMNPQCEVAFCRNITDDVHHIGFRDGIRLTDVELFMSVCRMHHDKIHSDPNWARENGYLLSRNKLNN